MGNLGILVHLISHQLYNLLQNSSMRESVRGQGSGSIEAVNKGESSPNGRTCQTSLLSITEMNWNDGYFLC